MTKILLVGPSLTKNLGGPSLFSSTCKILKAHIPDAEFTLWSPAPKRDSEKARGYGVRVIGTGRHELRNAFLRCLLWSLLKRLRLNISSLLNNNSNNFLKEYLSADIFIDFMGISFTDFFPTWRGNLRYGIRLLIGRLLGKPVVKFTQDMGPFEKIKTRYPAKFFLKRVDLIMARGAITQKYLRELGIYKQVHVRPDTAFVLDPAPAERIKNILLQEKLDKRPIIGITVTTQIDRRLSNYDTNTDNRYTLMIAQMTDYLVETLNALVVFIPNEIQGGYDDIHVAKKVINNVKNKGNVRLITTEYDAGELKGLIGACDFLIASRYHSIVAATSMCVPCVVIGWGHKYNDLMEVVGLSDFVFDFRTVEFENLQRSAEKLWQDKERISAAIASNMPAIEESVLSGGKLIKDLLEDFSRTL